MGSETHSSHQPGGWRLGYVIYSPDTDEYLASVADAGPVNMLAWCEYPDEALRWENLTGAEAAAHERADAQEAPGNRRYHLQVAELLDNGDRLTARTAAQIVAPRERVLSASELAALGFSDDFRPTAERLGIRVSHVRSVIERPDRITHLPHAGATFYLRKVSGLRPERHLLAAVDMGGPRREIIAAWPVPTSIAGPAPLPLATLELLCATVGNPLMFRGGRTNLVLGERHPEVPRDLTTVLSETGSPEGVLQVRVARDPDTGEMLIGWAYNIDDSRLRALLRG